jgi:hypothetical protein
MTSPNKYIVITTINRPTDAIREFAAICDHRLIVVGDRKTSPDWHLANVEYLSIERQAHLSSEFADAMPVNLYCLKNLGYIHAIQSGASAIVDADDDNQPKQDWGFPLPCGSHRQFEPGLGFVNAYGSFTTTKIWRRG